MTADAGDPEPISLATFCDGLADAICEWWERCRSPSAQCYSWPRWSGIVASCAAAQEALEADRVTFDGTEAARCLVAHRDNSCNSAPPIVFARDLLLTFSGDVRSCASMFSGRIESGEDCYTDNVLAGDECAEGSCYRETGACPGSCTPLRELDETCNSSAHLECEQGLHCDDDGVCAERKGEGTACTSTQSCAMGLRCVQTDADVIGNACHRVAEEVGGACSAFGACPSGSSCYEGSCHGSLPSGAPCATDAQCPEGERCVGPIDDDGPAVCRGRYALGDRCNLSDFCAGEALCYGVEGDPELTCRARGGLGAPCQSDTCQTGLYCSTGAVPACTERSADGQDCDDAPDSCEDGLQCMSDLKCHPLGEVGDPCDAVRGSGCLAGLFCDLSTATCAMPAAAGAACSPREATRSCATGLYCDCVEQAGDGYCPEGVTSPPPELYACVVQLANGMPCGADVECISGNCASSLKTCAAPEAGEGAVICSGP